jgi:hypothetical protein
VIERDVAEQIFECHDLEQAVFVERDLLASAFERMFHDALQLFQGQAGRDGFERHAIGEILDCEQ